MDKKNKTFGQLSRRSFIGYTSAAAIFTVIPPVLAGCAPKSGTKPDSTFGGVKIGAITYSFRELPGTNAEQTLEYLVNCGLSHCELMSGPIEESAGAPVINYMELMSRFMPGGRGGEMPPEFRQAMEEKQKEVTEWRKNCTSMAKFQEIRDMYNKAGVKIHIVKFDNIGDETISPEELEYIFRVTKAMGAKAITTELDEKKAERLAPLAKEHGIIIAFHNHTQLTPTTYSSGPYFSYGKNIMSNLDIGHFAAGTGQSALPLVKELAEEKRLFSIHLKDRTFGGDTVPFGQGDAQVAEILKLIQKNRWPIYCDIELEYPIPEGSDPLIETKNCVEFCRKVLVE
jgi:sugar phosphate isomerase/epimerase